MRMSSRKLVIQVITIAMSLICIATLFLPWLSIGVKSEQYGTIGGYTAINALATAYEGSDLNQVVREVFNEAQKLDLPASAKKQLIQQAKSVDSLLKILKTDRLSVYTTIKSAKIVTSLTSFFDKYIPDSVGSLSRVRSVTKMISLLGTVFAVLVVAAAGYNIFAALIGKKNLIALLPAFYAIGLLVTMTAVNKVNGSLSHAADGFGELALAYVGIDNLKILHISTFPIVVFILSCIATVACLILKKNVEKDLPATEIPEALRGAVTVVKDRATSSYGMISKTIAEKKADLGKKLDKASSTAKDELTDGKYWPKPIGEEEVPEGAGWVCSRCGKTNYKRYKFCPRCGLKQEVSAPTLSGLGSTTLSDPSIPTKVPKPVPDPARSAESAKFTSAPIVLKPPAEPVTAPKSLSTSGSADTKKTDTMPTGKPISITPSSPARTGGLKKGPRYKSVAPEADIKDSIPDGFFAPPEL